MNRSPSSRSAGGRWLLAFGLAALPAVLHAQEQGTCVAAQVPGAFTLPDGTAHAAGRVVLCLDRTLTPSIGLHQVAADGATTGLVRSRRRRTEMTAGHEPVVLFARRADGLLELLGYAVPDGRTTWSYDFAPTHRVRPPRSAAPGDPGAAVVAVLARR